MPQGIVLGLAVAGVMAALWLEHRETKRAWRESLERQQDEFYND